MQHQRRRTFIIHKRFQLKLIAFVFLCIAVASFCRTPVAFAFLSLVALAAALIFSYRIAGPIYRIEKALERWKRGNVEQGLKLQNGDEFRQLAVAYNQAASEFVSLRKEMRSACQKLQNMTSEMDAKHVAQIHEIIEELQCSIEKKN